VVAYSSSRSHSPTRPLVSLAILWVADCVFLRSTWCWRETAQAFFFRWPMEDKVPRACIRSFPQVPSVMAHLHVSIWSSGHSKNHLSVRMIRCSSQPSALLSERMESAFGGYAFGYPLIPGRAACWDMLPAAELMLTNNTILRYCRCLGCGRTASLEGACMLEGVQCRATGLD
jgi:hypothetical protein